MNLRVSVQLVSELKARNRAHRSVGACTRGGVSNIDACRQRRPTARGMASGHCIAASHQIAMRIRVTSGHSRCFTVSMFLRFCGTVTCAVAPKGLKLRSQCLLVGNGGCPPCFEPKVLLGKGLWNRYLCKILILKEHPPESRHSERISYFRAAWARRPTPNPRLGGTGRSEPLEFSCIEYERKGEIIGNAGEGISASVISGLWTRRPRWDLTSFGVTLE